MSESINPKSMFISYRRANKALALALFQRFSPEFDVFMDERPYDNSTRLSPFITRQIKSRAYFVMLITPSALHGHYFNNLFWREAELAIRHKRLIIPFVTHTSLWNFHRHYLINQLTRLSRLDGIPIALGKFNDSVVEIKERLNHVSIPPELTLHKIPNTDKTQAQAHIERLLSYPTVQNDHLRPIAYYERAYTYQFDKKQDEAFSQYTEAIRQSPTYADAYLARASLYNEEHIRLSDLRAAIEHDPHFADAYAALGDYHLAQGNYEHAVDAYSHAISINPHYAPYYTNRGNCYLALGDNDRAGDDFDQAVILESGEFDEAQPEPKYETIRFTATDFYKRGVESRKGGNPAFALKDLTDSIHLYADNPQAYYERGGVYYDLGDYARALADYDTALALNPYDDKVYVARGITRIELGDFTRAIADFTEAIRLNPHDASAFNHRGNLYHRREMFTEAVDDFTMVINMNTADASAYNNRGLAYRTLGEIDRAIKDYTEAIRLNPNFAHAYNNRGYAYYLLNDTDRALADIDRALDLMPSYTLAWQNRMLVWKRMRGM